MADAGEMRHLMAGGSTVSAFSAGATIDLFASVRRGPGTTDAFGVAAARWRAGDEAARQLTESLAKASLGEPMGSSNGCAGGGGGGGGGWGAASASSAGAALDTLALLGSLGLSDGPGGGGGGGGGSWPERSVGAGSALVPFDAQSDCVLNAAAQLMRSSEQQLSRHSSDSGHSSGTRDVSLLGMLFCSTCDDSSVSATHQCVECNDFLCHSCAGAHRRVRVTRTHTVLSLGVRPSGCCNLHQAAFTMVCNTCELPLCYACALDHSEHSLDMLDGAAVMAQQRTRATLQEAQAFLATLAEARHHAVSMAELVRERSARAQLDAAAAGDKLRAALASWQARLEKKAASVCQLKISRLHQQAEQLDHMRGRVMTLLEQLAIGAGDGEAEWVVRGLTADHQLRVMIARAQLSPPEDAAVRFVCAPGAAIDAMLRASGTIETAGCGAQSLLLERAAVPVVGRPYQLVIQVRDHYGDDRRSGDDHVQAQVMTPDRCVLGCDVEHMAGGRYRAAFIVRAPGDHTFSVKINGSDLAHSPWTRRAVSPRRLSTLGPVRVTIGGEGTEPGKLCRPWGVTFGSDGRIIVADRSNHRVQVFYPDGRKMMIIGGPGTKNGRLNRPAGVTVDSMDRLVVADKDNHRICVFTLNGEFILKFGEKGNRLGMFNYPWDVACNSLDQIAVTDTRNHRVQLFSPEGMLLKKFAQEGADWKEMDSPRGLTFHPDGKLYITDFNNHRIVALDTETGKMTYICREGNEPGRFVRPQGIAVDGEGRLYVSDCRNSRIQVLTTSGEFLMRFGEHGSRPGQFDQPQGIAIGPNGQVAVVCLENHRVQLF